jgi:hypothetical protein
MKTIVLAAILTACTCLTAFADIAPAPGKSSNRVKKPVTVDTQMDIKIDRNGNEARLLIPAEKLKQLRAELDLLESNDDRAAMGGLDSTMRTQTVMSGLLLSLAFVFGGLWFAKNRNIAVRSKSIGVVALLLAAGSAATLVYANAGPPAEARSITSRIFAQSLQIYGFGYGKVKLELTNGDRIQLIVPDQKADTKPVGEE